MNDSLRLMAAAGSVAALVAAFSWLADRRRMTRRNLDRVGFMPWTTIFFWSLFAAVLLLGISGRAFFGGD
jgi:hypothetical protein